MTPAPFPLLALAAIAMITLAGCSNNVPQLDAAVPDWAHEADYPALVPLTGDLGTAPDVTGQAERLENSLNARSARLQRRARDLNARAVVDDETRTRMRQGVRH